VQDLNATDFLEWQSLCTKCRINPRVATGAWCRTCLTADAKRQRHEHPELAREKAFTASLWGRFGIRPTDYEALLEAQDGLCPLCGDTLDLELKQDKNRRVHLDHDARTGQIRGVLCGRCNILIGHVQEDPDRLSRIARALPAYLTAEPPCPAQTKFPKA
jgi:hypothetical protein